MSSSASLFDSVEGLGESENMSDEDAQAKHDEVLALLDDDQKAQLEAVSLPRSFGRGGGRGGPGEEEQDANANPFQEEANATALTSLLQRFGGDDQPADPVPR